jgi:Lrp/AsnC family transcriptional regulator, regulator for asnA, asnC and gidA
MPNPTKIDETDAKILKTLLKDSRTSFTKMAKDCKITVGAVRMRYQHLWKEGVITGEIMQVNPQSLGFKCVADLGITTAKENETEVGRFLKTKPNLTHIVIAANNYSFWAKVILHDIQELNGIIGELESNPLIKHVDTFIWDETVYLDHPENLIIKPLEKETGEKGASTFAASHEEVRIDKIDRQIAKILSQNSRIPFSRIAKQLGISTKSVIQKYHKLKGSVLTHSSIMVDLNKLGYNAWGHVFVKAANRSKMPQIYNQMLQIPNLIVAIRYIGAYDLYATVALENYEEMFKLMESMRRIQSIEKTDIFLGRVWPQWPLNLFPSLLEA